MTVGNNIGYLKDSGGSKRLRFVKTGYDATDESVPPNKVIFDSQNIATLSILETGNYTWTGVDNTSGLEHVRTWSYGFIPLCIFQWEIAPYAGFQRGSFISSATPSAKQQIKVDTTGIYVQGQFTVLGTYSYVKLYWTAFGIDARDGA